MAKEASAACQTKHVKDSDIMRFITKIVLDYEAGKLTYQKMNKILDILEES